MNLDDLAAEIFIRLTTDTDIMQLDSSDAELTIVAYQKAEIFMIERQRREEEMPPRQTPMDQP